MMQVYKTNVLKMKTLEVVKESIHILDFFPHVIQSYYLIDLLI